MFHRFWASGGAGRLVGKRVSAHRNLMYARKLRYSRDHGFVAFARPGPSSSWSSLLLVLSCAGSCSLVACIKEHANGDGVYSFDNEQVPEKQLEDICKKSGQEVGKKKQPKKKMKENKVEYDKPEVELMKRERAIFLTGKIDDRVAHKIVTKLFLLDSVSDRQEHENTTKPTGHEPEAKQGLNMDKNISNEPITLYINSGGGKITSGLAIYDAMQTIKSPVHTCVVGRASSMAVIIAAAGSPGRRMAYENSRFMVHEASSSLSKNQVSDLVLSAKETVYKNNVLIKLLVRHTGQSYEYVKANFERDFYMSAEEAVAFGIIDTVIHTTSKI